MRKIEVGRRALEIEDVEAVADESATIELDTTGYGDSCTVAVADELIGELPVQLTRYHGCGSGRFFPVAETRAVMTARLASLCRGYSGVGFDLLELLAKMVNAGITPLIPEESEGDDARQRFLQIDRVPQSGQGQHGHDCGAGLSESDRTD